jgi:hypothetical protein
MGELQLVKEKVNLKLGLKGKTLNLLDLRNWIRQTILCENTCFKANTFITSGYTEAHVRCNKQQ